MRSAAPLAEGWAGLRGREPLFSKFTLHTLSHHQAVSHEKATRALGYHPRPFSETLGDAFDWFASAGMLAGRSGS
jgi:dihydroflavonol-4-reductase